MLIALVPTVNRHKCHPRRCGGEFQSVSVSPAPAVDIDSNIRLSTPKIGQFGKKSICKYKLINSSVSTKYEKRFLKFVPP